MRFARKSIFKDIAAGTAVSDEMAIVFNVVIFILDLSFTFIKIALDLHVSSPNQLPRKILKPQISSPDSTSFLFSHGSSVLSQRHNVEKIISGDCHLGCRSVSFQYFEKWCRRQSIVGTSLKVLYVGVLLFYFTLLYFTHVAKIWILCRLSRTFSVGYVFPSV